MFIACWVVICLYFMAKNIRRFALNYVKTDGLEYGSMKTGPKLYTHGSTLMLPYPSKDIENKD